MFPLDGALQTHLAFAGVWSILSASPCIDPFCDDEQTKEKRTVRVAFVIRRGQINICSSPVKGV